MRALTTWLLLVGLAVPAIAQETPAPPPTAEGQPIDAAKLGVDLARIKRGLRVAETKEKTSSDGLRLNFSVQVYGQAPRIDVLQGIDLFNGAVPGTAPSHNQMIEFWTPEIYRSPTMPVSALAFWAAQQIWKKSAKSKCEEEIANYRALIMQGVNIAAPRCTQ
ncbi:MAG TPA: hypothetical protein VM096_11855 [Vicinamibacterales bacterium]|nr:hypothetical protein [Vicinamibacterales bacterium]